MREKAETTSVRELPHWKQKRAPDRSGLLQEGHAISSMGPSFSASFSRVIGMI